MGRVRARPHAGPAAALEAAVAAVSEAIRRIADDARFRTYDPHVGTARRHAREALDAFLAGHSVEAAVAVIRDRHDGERALALAVSTLRMSAGFRDVVAQATRHLSEILPANDPGLAGRMAERACTDELSRQLIALDPSHPLDLIDGEEVVICFMPGAGMSALSVRDAVTSHFGEHSDCTTILPDTKFARFLELANVSPSEYVAMVRRHRGVDLAASATEWEDLSVRIDRDRGHLVDETTLLDGIDGASYGFNPLIAFLAPARYLIERDWSLPLSVTGGILGLHNFVNGSGDPRRFEERIVISPAAGDLMVGEGIRNDFAEVHGLQHDAFASELSCDGGMAPPAP